MSISIPNQYDLQQSGFAVSSSARTQAAEQAAPETDAAAKNASGDDYVVDISEAAKRLRTRENMFAKAIEGATGGIAGAKAGKADDEDDSADKTTQQIKQIRKRIEALRKEIDEIRQGEGTDEEKNKRAAVKEAELASLQAQLMQLLKDAQSQQGGSGGLTGNTAFYKSQSLT